MPTEYALTAMLPAAPQLNMRPQLAMASQTGRVRIAKQLAVLRNTKIQTHATESSTEFVQRVLHALLEFNIKQGIVAVA
jgi:hypothetical protein